jgi:hypothetical protein
VDGPTRFVSQERVVTCSSLLRPRSRLQLLTSCLLVGPVASASRAYEQFVHEHVALDRSEHADGWPPFACVRVGLTASALSLHDCRSVFIWTATIHLALRAGRPRVDPGTSCDLPPSLETQCSSVPMESDRPRRLVDERRQLQVEITGQLAESREAAKSVQVEAKVQSFVPSSQRVAGIVS